MFVNKGLPTEIKDAPTVPAFTSGLNGAWSTHTKPSHTRVNSPHFWSTHPIYEIKKDYSEGDLWYLAPIV